jgi:RNA polymerase sigma-70 factor, ECF subfamily
MSGDSGDQLLVERARGGDTRAFDLLVLKYQQRILRLAQRYVHDPTEALDVCQEVFIKAWRALAGFRGESAFYTWLYRIAINTANNYVVAQRRRPLDYELDGRSRDQPDPLDRLRDDETPEALAMQAQLQQTVIAAVAELPDELRTAITLCEIEGLSYEQIALVMECPIGTIRSRIFRARAATDERIRPLLEGTGK